MARDNTRSKVAAAAASVVPFHCVICVEEFSSSHRPPVVLPCGHTFVCLPCSKRIQRCMECREPLFIVPQVNSSAVSSSKQIIYRTNGERYSPTPVGLPLSTSAPTNVSASIHMPIATSINPIPLPVPKNVVLLALMEAAERQNIISSVPSTSDSISDSLDETEIDNDSDQCTEEDDAFDLNKIISSVATISGPCGTYIVAGPESLAILSKDPRSRDVVESNAEDALIKILDDTTSFQNHLSKNKPPVTIRKGQRVQIVDFSDGVAKLARNEGFIVCDASQLKKVGGPIDESCRLEGILDTVKNREADLLRALDENKAIETNLRKQIVIAQSEEPLHSIVTEAPDDIVMPAYSRDGSDTQPSTPSESDGKRPRSFRTPERYMRIPRQVSSESSVEFEDDGIAVYASATAFPHSPNSIDNSDLLTSRVPLYRQDKTDDDINELVFGCGSAFLGNNELLGESIAMSNYLSMPMDRREASLRRIMSHGGEMPYLHPTPSSSFDGINFRTGMSGHRALLSTKTSRDNAPRGEVRMMSEHRGIAPMRGSQRKQPPTMSTLHCQYTLSPKSKKL